MSEPDTGISAEAQTQQYGYIRCYRAVSMDCGRDAAYLYGILEDYVQLGARNGRAVAPSHDHLARLMDCHRNTIILLMKKLRDAGWVVQRETIGGTNEYYLPARNLHKNQAGGARKSGTPCTETGHKQEHGNKTALASPPLTPPDGGKYTLEFESFWKDYGKTAGPKAPAFKAWQRLSAKERVAAVAMLTDWRAYWAKDNDEYKPYPQKYLNQKMWEGDASSRVTGNGRLSEDELAEFKRQIKEIAEAP